LLRSYVAHNQTRTKPNGEPVSGSQVNSLVRSLHAFCTWLREDEWVDRDLFAKVTIPRTPRLVQETFTPDEIRSLLAAAHGTQRNARRNEALILFMLDTGCRAGEVCALRADEIDWERRIAKVLGKGRKERYVPFSTPTARAMRRYAAKERRGGSDRLFESEEGRPLTPSGLGQICTRLSRRTGIKAHPHKFRHTFAIASLPERGLRLRGAEDARAHLARRDPPLRPHGDGRHRQRAPRPQPR
ncbi:MAG: tyrosine-type recombinase/integrase, partial [Chloroflexota bacterium]|nr:tyrosine-type recombinase/integrase [Chloroflexota bacterium]